MNNWTWHPKTSVFHLVNWVQGWLLTGLLLVHMSACFSRQWAQPGEWLLHPFGRDFHRWSCVLGSVVRRAEPKMDSEERSDLYEVWGSCVHSQERILKSRFAKQICASLYNVWQPSWDFFPQVFHRKQVIQVTALPNAFIYLKIFIYYY